MTTQPNTVPTKIAIFAVLLAILYFNVRDPDEHRLVSNSPSITPVEKAYEEEVAFKQERLDNCLQGVAYLESSGRIAAEVIENERATCYKKHDPAKVIREKVEYKARERHERDRCEKKYRDDDEEYPSKKEKHCVFKGLHKSDEWEAYKKAYPKEAELSYIEAKGKYDYHPKEWNFIKSIF